MNAFLLAAAFIGAPIGVFVSWDQVTQDVDGNPETVAGYTIYVQSFVVTPPAEPDGMAATKITTTWTDVEIADLMPAGGNYRIWVDAFDVAGNKSDYSASIDVEVPEPASGDVDPPTPPTEIKLK